MAEEEYDLSKLTDRQLDLIKLELELLEQRVIHLEGLQYQLRQFSVALWTLTLGVGLGVSQVTQRDVRLVAASGLIPLVFLYLDAWYARAAQRFRTRRLEIAELLNANHPKAQFEILDITASKVRRSDPRARYRENIAVKATRTVRVFFYGFQIIGTVLLCTLLWLSSQPKDEYLALAWLYPLPVLVAFGIKMRMQGELRKKGFSIAPVAEDPFELAEHEVGGGETNEAHQPANPGRRAGRLRPW